MQDCRCSRCQPTSVAVRGRVSVCSRCGGETRFGLRDGAEAWWHRGTVDHCPCHGHNVLPVRGTSTPKMEDEEVVEGMQAAQVEVRAHDVDPGEFPGTSGIRQLVNLVTGEARVAPSGKPSRSKGHPPAAPGWELVNLQHARGPYRGARGEVLSVSDSHVLRARARRVDGTVDVAVASYRDLKFDFAYVGTIRDGSLAVRQVGSDDLKKWIKGIDVSND